MARYRGAVCRICRTQGEKLFLKGERCNTGKCSIVKTNYRPGQHGQNRQKHSEYAIRLREKQKLRKIYGILERQFRKYYEMASRQKGVTGERLLQLLETRLDNIVFRLGFTTSRAQARQLVNHGHVKVNDRKVDIPSFQVKIGHQIQIKSNSLETVKTYIAGDYSFIPSWLSCNKDELTGQLVALPARSDIPLAIKENLVIEFYSR